VIDDQDELLWGAAWLYKATKIDTYRKYLVNNANTLGGATVQVNAFNWDNKYAGAQILSAQVRTDELPLLHGFLRLDPECIYG
jgi:endoglucanase